MRLALSTLPLYLCTLMPIFLVYSFSFGHHQSIHSTIEAAAQVAQPSLPSKRQQKQYARKNNSMDFLPRVTFFFLLLSPLHFFFFFLLTKLDIYCTAASYHLFITLLFSLLCFLAINSTFPPYRSTNVNHL